MKCLTRAEIYIKRDFDDLKQLIISKFNNKKCCIISDTKASSIYFNDIENVFSGTNISLYKYITDEGEKSKDFNNIYKISLYLIDKGFSRDDFILSLGGGVVTDISGFVASIYMRGIDYINIPTSLLAQVDASVGGKTAVNLDGYKNILGSFYEPEFVYINTELVKTLEKKEYINGMFEVIKHSLIGDDEYFKFIKNNTDNILNLDSDTLYKMISLSVEYKSKVVNDDFKENDKRRILNFGHTFGHVIEKISDFKIGHGVAIGIGMIFALFLSEKTGYIKNDLKEDYIDVIKKYIYLSGSIDLIKELDLNYDLISHMYKDKKVKNGKLNFVLLSDKEPFIADNIDKEDFRYAVDKLGGFINEF